MTKIYIYILLIAGCCISCKKFLDVKPKSQIKEELLFEKERGFVDALSGTYTLMARRNLYGDNLTMSFLDLLAQRYKSVAQTSPYWDAVNYNYEGDVIGIKVKSTIRTIWLSSYAVIANANNILSNMENRKSVFKGDNYNLIKGEALGIRAFLHFDLLRMYGPMMNSNSSAPSIPYRIDLSKNAQPLMAGNEIAKLIIADLLQAEELLKNDPIVSNASNDYYDFSVANRKFRMNLLAVQGTLARVYQYTNQPAQAYIYAKKVIDAGKYAFVDPTDVSLTGACRDRTFRNEQVFALQINNMKEYTDAYFVDAPGTYEQVPLNNDDKVIQDVFEITKSSTDIRYLFLWESKAGKLFNVKYLQFVDQPGACVWPKNVVPILRISEMFYIAAESSTDLSESVDLMNTVVTNRGIKPLTGITDKISLQREITKEYQKEFFSEGQLFYYYKRNGFTTIPGSTVIANSKIYVLPVPQDELIFNN